MVINDNYTYTYHYDAYYSYHNDSLSKVTTDIINIVNVSNIIFSKLISIIKPFKHIQNFSESPNFTTNMFIKISGIFSKFVRIVEFNNPTILRCVHNNFYKNFKDFSKFVKIVKLNNYNFVFTDFY